ncbi:MAG TPA: TolC family protein [Chitinophagaceae bacterium]|nr:TolC family protein [Chitinophagaceae bacterium]
MIRYLTILLFLPFTAFAQDSLPVISSEDAVRLALENNLDIKIVQGDRDIAAINNNWGNAGKWPTVNANIANTEAVSNLNQVLSNGSEIKRNGVTNNVLNANLQATWRIYNGNRITATKKRYEELEKIGELSVTQEMQRISFDVLVAYYNIVRLNQQVKATQAIIALSEERYNIAKTRFDVGSAAKTDMLQSGIDMNEQRINLNDIERQIKNNKAILNTLLKRPADMDFAVADSTFQIPQLDYNIAISKIDSQNLTLLIAERERAVLAEERRIINSQRLPVLSLNSTTSYNRTKATGGFFLTNQTYGPNIGLGLGIPIYNSNVFKTQLRVNEVQQKQQKLQTELIRTQLQRDIYVAFEEFRNAAHVAEVERINVKIAEENNFISTERFKKLQGNTIELRQAQLSLIEAQDRYINALFREKLAATAIQLILGEVGNE